MAAFHFDTAIVRRPGKSVAHGLRAGGGEDPDFDALTIEHNAYIDALSEAGVDPIVLPPLEDFPDAIFVEDPALVFPQGAILLRPGARSRLGEAAAISSTLHNLFDQVLELPEGAYAEGGDILTTDKKVMIGLSARTDIVGAKSLQDLLANIGRESEIVKTPKGVLHFKTDCALLDEETVLATTRLADSGVFEGFDIVTTPPGEEAAANALRVNDVVLVGSQFPRTIELLESRGFTVVPLSTVEIGKVDAGLSCMSLRWKRKS